MAMWVEATRKDLAHLCLREQLEAVEALASLGACMRERCEVIELRHGAEQRRAFVRKARRAEEQRVHHPDAVVRT